MTKKFRVYLILIVLAFIAINLCGCFDIYAEYRYPTAKEAVEANGNTVKNVYGAEELNGVICYLFDHIGDGSYKSIVLIENENGYCAYDKFGDYYIKLISFDEGVVHYIVSYKKFENYVLEIRLLDYQNLPTVTDTIGNSGLIITISEGSAMAYLVLDKVPDDYKICVDGIWYPIPQSEYEHFNNIPPQ
ncbi:MAG: hypothetical protein PHO33_03100 [Clostridia bacterium]|nr:hypothetical protein [Clostridia bacterium]